MPLFDWIRSDLHSLNLDWIISKIKTVEESEQGAVDAAADANSSKTAAAASATAANNSKTAAAGSATAAAGSAAQAQALVDQLDTTIAQDVSDWLDEHITPTTPAVDDTLTVSGAAADAAVTGDKITELKTEIQYNKSLLETLFSYNQIDYGDITENKYVSTSSGALINSNDFDATGFIDLKGNTSIVISDGTARYAFYNSNYEFISGNLIGTQMSPVQYPVAEGAVYARFTIDKLGNGGFVCFGTLDDYIALSDVENLKTIQTNISTNSDMIDKIGQIIPVDRINRSTLTENKFVRASNGNLISSTSFDATDYIDLTGVTKFVIGKGTAQFAYYKADKTYLSGETISTVTQASEYTVPENAVYARFSIEKDYADGAVYFMTLAEYTAFVGSPVIVIGTGEEFTTLKDGIAEAIKYANTKVIVKAGTYDLIEEFGSSYFENFGTTLNGIVLKNGIDITFEQGALVTCNYTGSNQNVWDYFSPFYFHGESYREYLLSEYDGFEIHNLRFEGSNTRYVFHDEASGRSIPYRNVYDHCEVTFDASTYGNFVQCIGGGLGEHGEIVVKDCIFSSVLNSSDPCPAVSYHNNVYHGGNTTDLSSIVVSGCAFVGTNNTLRLGYIGAATEKTKCIAYSNLFNAQPYVTAEQSSAQNVNMELIAYNNTVQ